MNDLLHDTTDVAVSLSVVERPELGRRLVQASVCREDGAAAVILVSIQQFFAG